MKVVQILRDPFARATLLRALIPSDQRSTTCCNCGCDNPRFRYAWEPDSIGLVSLHWSRAVCSVGCYRSYYDNGPGTVAAADCAAFLLNSEQ